MAFFIIEQSPKFITQKSSLYCVFLGFQAAKYLYTDSPIIR